MSRHLPRVPLAPLLTYTRLSAGRLAVIAGYTFRTGLRWAQHGVDVDQADELAITFGSHPAVLWPDWFEIIDALDDDKPAEPAVIARPVRSEPPRGFIRERSGPRGVAFELRVYAGRDPATGRERRISRTVRGTRAEAEQVLRELTQAV